MIAKIPFDQLYPASSISKMSKNQQLYILLILQNMYNQEQALANVVADYGAINGKIPIIGVENDITGIPVPNNASFCDFNSTGSIKVGGDYIECLPFSHDGWVSPCEDINHILQDTMQPTTDGLLASDLFSAALQTFAKKVIRAKLQTMFFGDTQISGRSFSTPEAIQAFGAYDGFIQQAASYLSANAASQIVTGIAGTTVTGGSGQAIGLIEQVYNANERIANYNPMDVIIECSSDFYKALALDVGLTTGFGTAQPRADLVNGISLPQYGGVKVVLNPAWSDLYKTYNNTITTGTAHLAVIRPTNTFRAGFEGKAANNTGVINYYRESASSKSNVRFEASSVHGAKVLLPETLSMIM
jgi:hypothetical protein